MPPKHVPYFKPGKELKDLINRTPTGDDSQSVEPEVDAAPVAAS